MRYLDDEGADQNANKDHVVKQAFENISLAVDFSRVDLVEKLHQDKCVEDDGEVDRGPGGERGANTTLGDSKHAWFEEEKENNDELWECYVSEVIRRSTW